MPLMPHHNHLCLTEGGLEIIISKLNRIKSAIELCVYAFSNFYRTAINRFKYLLILPILSHFKGHQMGGFGGALKNVAIGIASSDGKARIHSAGVTDDPAVLWDIIAEQDAFLESMADACKGVFDHFGDKKLFINVANNLSVDCDCNGNPAAPKMAEFGILASLDPVALDRACVDMVFNSSDPGKDDLIERINSRHGTHILDAAEQLGIGSQKYKLVTIE